MVRPEEFESPAFWFVAKRSIQLSYGRKLLQAYYKMVRVARFERATPWSQAIGLTFQLYPDSWWTVERSHFRLDLFRVALRYLS